ncbi:hypothetical protein EDC96DRAFT_578740 [Choanephora cucurbitarum]|nr:hypothetical protein EDC96DRAFT_578740 [Choanephora cucurbitarum]
MHGILKLTKHIDIDLVRVFRAPKIEGLYRHFSMKVFGKPARLNSTLKLDLLADYDDDGNSKKLKPELSKIVSREDGVVSRTVDGIASLVCTKNEWGSRLIHLE